MDQVIIRVPASTSNLGPGFDCLGVALRIYNTVAVARGASDRQSPRIVSQAAELFFKRARRRQFSFSCSITEQIPRARGLGGSATIRLGILHALNHLSGNPLDRLSIFQLCAQLEGHPDNAAPASFGGFTIARGQNVQRFAISPRLYFVLLIPDFEVKTSKARKVLPLKVLRTAAVENCGNACAITAAFVSRNYGNLRGAFVDRLHQPFRQKLIPFFPRVIAAAEKSGALGAFLSGSGSTICAITLQDRHKVADAMRRAARFEISSHNHHDRRQSRCPDSGNQKSEVIEMGRRLENLEQFGIDVVLERRRGFRASILRGILYALSFVYEWLVQLRLYLYRKRIFRERALGCLVISIGNLTVGGTGKTPIVEKFARALQTGGRRIAILSRGYKSVPLPSKRSWLNWLRNEQVDLPRVVSDGKSLLLDSLIAGDEPYMLAHNLKDVVVLVDKDRVKSGRFAIDKWKVDTLVLDDGLQYLHLKHRLDIVLVDRQAPFGNEFLLPRGTLRESPRNLRRASYIFITKSTGEPNDALVERIRRYNRTAEIIECAHKPLYLQDVFTGERLQLERLRDTFIGSICGIAAPESFEGGLKRLGARVDLAKRYIDHHYYTEAELQSFMNRCIRRDLEMIVTTEKDAVRMPRLPEAEVKVPIYFLRVEIEILSGHESWEHCVARICKPQPLLSPERFFA